MAIFYLVQAATQFTHQNNFMLYLSQTVEVPSHQMPQKLHHSFAENYEGTSLTIYGAKRTLLMAISNHSIQFYNFLRLCRTDWKINESMTPESFVTIVDCF